jgi:tocopherol O-methyltransferase
VFQEARAMIHPRTEQAPADVSRHYDDLSAFYLDLWGEHVHHGLWETGKESPEEAVLALVRHLADRLQLTSGERLCDIGCGYGATARLLAGERGVEVTGLTLSRAQWEHACARPQPDPAPAYRHADWLDNDLPDAAFDAAVSIESSEHMADKPRFFSEAFRVLRPGGRMGVYAWLARDDAGPRETRRLLEPICREGRLPSMGDEGDYRRLFAGAGFVDVDFEDLSRRVRKTWTLCVRRVLRRFLTDAEARRFFFSGPADRQFAATVFRILLAYRTGAMRYGLFTARRPG